jgi:hypothetical protein
MSTKRGPIAEIPFTDGTRRAVFEEADGRQYVLDGREKVYRVWVLVDEPTEVVDPCST